MDVTAERAYVERAAIALVVLLAGLMGGNVVHARVDPEPSRFELVTRCLQREKGLDLFEPSVASAAFGRDADAVSTVIEGNPVTIALAHSVDEAERLEDAARASAGASRVERRIDVVYEWASPPSPTQKQTGYDCEHLPDP